MAECSIPDCAKDVQARGWCAAHYRRWWQFGDPLRGGDLKRQFIPADGRCNISGCESPHEAHGLCDKHYQRWRRHGDPERSDLRRPLPDEPPSYEAVHFRLAQLKGPAAKFACVDCGGKAREWSYRGGAPDEMVGQRTRGPYSADPAFYVPRCKRCHIAFDGVAAKVSEARRRK